MRSVRIGMVGDVRNGGLHGEVEAEMYVPYSLRPEDPGLNLIVRTLADSPPVISRIRTQLRDMDKQMFVNFSSMDQQISEMVFGPKFNAILVVTFAGLAMVLALVGIYGVMSYSIAQRTQKLEFEWRWARRDMTSCDWYSGRH
jgi:putative ABC transport system permease protein